MILNMQTARGRAVGGWLTHLAAAGRSRETIRIRRIYVEQALAALDPRTVTTAQIEAWIITHPQWSVETHRAAVASLRGFFGWYYDSGFRGDDPAAKLKPPRQPDPAPHPTPRDALCRALATTEGKAHVLLRLLSTTGLRRSEAAAVHSRDLDGDWLTVRGKGRRVRRVPVPPDVAGAIRDADGYLFPGGVDGHCSPWWVSTTAKRATGYSAHSLRHLFATSVWRATGDLLAVQRLLGHADAATTQRYVMVDADRIAQAAAAAWVA